MVFDTGIPQEILTDPIGVLGPSGALFDLRMELRPIPPPTSSRQ